MRTIVFFCKNTTGCFASRKKGPTPALPNESTDPAPSIRLETVTGTGSSMDGDRLFGEREVMLVYN